MRNIFYIAQETFLLLRRDKVFLPAVVAGILIAAFANLVTTWSISDLHKVLFDIGVFGFQITGSLVALFWGHRMIADSRQDGALEVQLASPVSRTTWLLGKYLGLAFALVFLGGVLLILWQALMQLNGFGIMSRQDLLILVFTILGWLVLAALALFFATFSRPQVALFATLCMWFAGLTTSLVAATLGPDTPLLTRQIVEFLARFWDFQQFNLIDWVRLDQQITDVELGWRAAYGVTLIVSLLTAGSVIFRRRDLAG